VTKEEIKDNPDLFDLQKVDLGNVNKDLLKLVIQKVEAGGIEFWFNTATSNFQFSDNINVYKTFGANPKNENNLPSLSKLSSEYTKVYGKDTKCYKSELREINGLNTMYIDCDGVVEGTRSLQYVIQKSQGVQILITATCKNSVLDTIRDELNNIIKSLRMN